jgi:hypothetical protein
VGAELINVDRGLERHEEVKGYFSQLYMNAPTSLYYDTKQDDSITHVTENSQ